MQWFQNAFASSSSPNNNSNNNKINLKDLNINYFRKAKRSRRLTRQRKLRHLSDIDIDVGRHPLTNLVRFSDNPDVYSDLDFASARSSPAPLPQPLPLPELSLFFKDSPPNASRHSESGHFPLPSPKARAPSEDKNKSETSPARDDSGAGNTTNGNGRTSSYQIIHKNREPVDTLSTKSPFERGKKALQEQNGAGNVQNNFRVTATSAMSAPGSGVSSPSLSPRRMSTGDYPLSPYAASPGFVWSAPEMAAMDMFVDPSVQFSVDKNFPFNDRSPRHPRGLSAKSPSCTASPLHPKLSSEISSAWQDNNSHVNVHPLPLPPGPTVSSQSVLPHQTINKCDVSKMAGQWQKGKLIGRGTYGTVYVATNRETGALCAMKEVDLIPDDPKSTECMQQLEQEIKVLSQLKHPNIVQYYGSEIVGNHFYIYLEYVHPGSINKFVREHYGAITESVVRSFTRHILHGLAYLHGTKTIHRDIKGANLLVDASGVVKLADFGTAKHLSGQVADLSMKGSPYWMAPEMIHAVDQKDSNSELAFAVDIWSLGCTIIEIVNGKPPWSELEGAAAMFKVWKETPPIPEALSLTGKDFLQCCFRRNPAERPSASKLLEHPFVNHTFQTDTQACTQSFSAMKLGDAIQRPREMTTQRVETMPVSSQTLITKGKLSCNGETSLKSHPKTSDTAAACLQPPRSTLEAHSSLSSPHSNCVQASRPSKASAFYAWLKRAAAANVLLPRPRQ